MKIILIFTFLILGLFGCMTYTLENVAETPQEPNTSTTPFPMANTTPSLFLPTITQIAWITEIPANLHGKLILSNPSTTELVEYDLENHSSLVNSIPGGCLITNGIYFICGVLDTSRSEFSELTLVNTSGGIDSKITDSPVWRGDIHIDNLNKRSFIYARNTDNPNQSTLIINDLASGKRIHEFEIDARKWFMLPIPINNGDAFFGLSVPASGKGIEISRWLPENDQKETIYKTQENIGTNGFSISPDGNQLAIPVHFGVKDPEANYDFLQFFNTKSNALTKLDTPKDFSFPLRLFRNNSWSPDGNLFLIDVAVDFYNLQKNPENQICIIDTKALTYKCQNDFGVETFSWSPDSKHIAMISYSGDLIIYSIEEEKSYNLGKINFSDLLLSNLSWVW